MEPKRELRRRTRWLLSVRDSDLPANAKFAAFTLATYMDQDGMNAWPSQQTLAKAMSVSPKRVRTGLHEQREQGWILEDRRGKGGQSYDMLRVPAIPRPRERPVEMTHLSGQPAIERERCADLAGKTGQDDPKDRSGRPPNSSTTSNNNSPMPEVELSEEEFRRALRVLQRNPSASWANVAFNAKFEGPEAQAKAAAAIRRARQEEELDEAP